MKKVTRDLLNETFSSLSARLGADDNDIIQLARVIQEEDDERKKQIRTSVKYIQERRKTDPTYCQ